MTRHSHQSSSSRRKQLKYLLFFFLLFLLGFATVKAIKYFPVWYGLMFKKEITVIKPQQQRVNLLLLGIGGGKHDGPNLTDTIIFASIDPTQKRITLVSIPRDLWIPDLKSKINVAYASGEDKKAGGGLLLTKAVVSKVLGQPIDYAIRVDFAGFVKAVDMVGGLDIDVDRTLDDPEYPLTGKEDDTCGHTEEELPELATASSQLEAFPCRYEHLLIQKGQQHLDGETALKYVRSRHAVGVEGTDFARSQRQQKIISAFRAKIFSIGTILNPVKMVSLYDVFKQSIDTDIKQEEYDDFVRLAQKMEKAKLESVVIDIGDEGQDRPGLLENPEPSEEYSYAWVLTPKAGSGNYTQISRYVSCMIKYDNCDVETGNPLLPTPSTAAPSDSALQDK